ncbi:MAG: hypothetical protein PHV21_04340 [Synergistaceae bacterium]|nr:hypothetical protein [Synergistaceae bacterium]MDD3916229.1 hypothetical protein [Synergistaceae bacterium]
MNGSTEKTDMSSGARIQAKNNPIAVTFAFRRNRLRIHKATLEALHRPRYIQLLIHTQANVFVIRGCGTLERDCFKVAENLFDKPSVAYELTSRLFMRAILNQTGWDENYSYRLNGRYSEELGVVSFDMNHPERITVK